MPILLPAVLFGSMNILGNIASTSMIIAGIGFPPLGTTLIIVAGILGLGAGYILMKLNHFAIHYNDYCSLNVSLMTKFDINYYRYNIFSYKNLIDNDYQTIDNNDKEPTIFYHTKNLLTYYPATSTTSAVTETTHQRIHAINNFLTFQEYAGKSTESDGKSTESDVYIPNSSNISNLMDDPHDIFSLINFIYKIDKKEVYNFGETTNNPPSQYVLQITAPYSPDAPTGDNNTMIFYEYSNEYCNELREGRFVAPLKKYTPFNVKLNPSHTNNKINNFNNKVVPVNIDIENVQQQSMVLDVNNITLSEESNLNSSSSVCINPKYENILICKGCGNCISNIFDGFNLEKHYGPPINIAKSDDTPCIMHFKCAINLHTLYPLDKIRFLMSLIPGFNPIPLIDIHNIHPYMPAEIIEKIDGVVPIH